MTNENREIDEIETTETNHTTENLESVGQIIIGGLEQIGGILTGDPLTRAEGEFNAESGRLHQEANKNLDAIEHSEKADQSKTDTTAPFENKE